MSSAEDEGARDFTPTKHFIAYVDILGYGHLIKERGITTMAKIIDEAIREARAFPEVKGVKQKVFSDNFLFCGTTEQEGIEIYKVVSYLQHTLILEGIFVRGAMCYGNISWSDDFVCGDGLIDVYKLESIAAIYPRILVHDNFISHLEPMHKMYGKLDDDYFHFVDYLKLCLSLIAYDDSEKTVEIILDYLALHRDLVVKNLLVYRGNTKIQEKYQWCKRYHNNFCKEHGFSDYLID